MNKIPEVMAYLFALWTLQNTEYYVEMKGAIGESERKNFLI